MQKETEKTIGFFCHIFIVGGILIGGDPSLLSHPSPDYAYGSGGEAPSRFAIVCNFLEKKLSKYRCITFRTCSEPFERTRNF